LAAERSTEVCGAGAITAPCEGLALFCDYTAFSIAIAAVLLVRRDT
jgi:hypothetical protein